MKNRKGLTIIELLVAVGVFALLVTVLVPGLGSFFSRLEVHTALRTVTAGLSAARYQAIRDNRPVRAEVAGGKLLLSRGRRQRLAGDPQLRAGRPAGDPRQQPPGVFAAGQRRAAVHHHPAAGAARLARRRLHVRPRQGLWQRLKRRRLRPARMVGAGISEMLKSEFDSSMYLQFS